MGVRWCAVWGREIETNWFFEENNSSARASHFLVHFSARASHFLVHFSARYDVNHIMRKVPTELTKTTHAVFVPVHGEAVPRSHDFAPEQNSRSCAATGVSPSRHDMMVSCKPWGKISSSEYKTDIRSSLAKNVGEKEGEPAKGESRLFQSNNLSYADIN